MNPLAYLLPALLATLKAPPLEWNGAAVKVYQHLPGNEASHYVVIEQPTDADAPGSTGCDHFSCTVLLNVVTQFAEGVATSSVVESLVTQINARLRRKRLELAPGWDCQPGELTPGIELRETDGESILVRRLLRYRWEVYYNQAADTGAPLAPVRRVQAGRIRAINI
jgi:hypothetical protein